MKCNKDPNCLVLLEFYAPVKQFESELRHNILKKKCIDIEA